MTITNPTQTAWVFNEDEALKEKLQGYSTINYADGRSKKIEVYYRFPDAEIRTRTFPHIAIDLVRIEFDETRAHRALSYVPRYPIETATPLLDFTLVADDMPLPWMMIYQLATYAREPRDDRFMTMMMYQLFPEMFGFLDMGKFDGTVRRADLVQVDRRDTVDNENKRLYRNIYTVAISTEFYLNQLQYIQNISSIDIDFNFTGATLVLP
jgi:hypothetical protein